jgi:hypothetical protein
VTGAHMPKLASELAVTCWCERHIVYVTADDVWAGRTRSCAHRECVELERKHRRT